MKLASRQMALKDTGYRPSIHLSRMHRAPATEGRQADRDYQFGDCA